MTNFKEKSLVEAIRPDPTGSKRWKKDDVLLYLGDVYGMEGHGIFVTQQGLTFFGIHNDNFVSLNKENDVEEQEEYQQQQEEELCEACGEYHVDPHPYPDEKKSQLSEFAFKESK